MNKQKHIEAKIKAEELREEYDRAVALGVNPDTATQEELEEACLDHYPPTLREVLRAEAKAANG